MTESLVWNKKSIMDLTIDTMIESTGTATLSDGSLTLGANSSCEFSYTFDTTDNIMETSDLKFILNVINSNETVSSRYDESVQIEAYIQYYEKTVDSSGNITGYLLGGNDTYQINPYFRHEVEGYTDTYEVNIDKNMLSHITIYFINMSENSITFIKPQLFNSMSIMDAIDEYGGGDEPGGGSPPLIEDLMLYSTSGEYSMNKHCDTLTLEVTVPDDYLKQYGRDVGFNYQIDLHWIFTNESGNPIITTSYSTYGTILDGKTYVIDAGRCILTSLSNGVKRVRVELAANNTIYAERLIRINNNNITDMKLTLGNSSGLIDGTDSVSAEIMVLPETTKDGNNNHADIQISIDNYEGYAMLENGSTSNEYKLTGGKVNFSLYGKRNGKIKIASKIINNIAGNEGLAVIFPTGFTKEFIVDVVNTHGDLIYIETLDSTIIDSTKEYIDITIVSETYNFRYDYSNYNIESLDGQGKAYIEKITLNDSKRLIVRIHPLSIGKIRFSGEMVHHYSGASSGYAGHVEQELEITGLYKNFDIDITTNTGLFEITDGSGQLEVYPRPNYDYYGDISFSQVSIDGGSVSIDDKGDYALITANKDGRLNLICTPTNGPSKQVEITISGQYPENVQLTTGSGEFKVALGGNLTVFAESGNTPNQNYDRYNWTFDKLYPDSNVSQSTEYKYTQLTGSGLGKIMLNCIRQVDNKLMASAIIKIVQSLDSDKTVINYPDTYKYWVLFRVTSRSNKVYLLTINDTVTLNKLILKSDTNLYTDNVTLGSFKQYSLNGGVWSQYGSWSGGTNCAGSISVIYASNLPIYDENNNIIVNASTYNDIDWNLVLYGETVDNNENPSILAWPEFPDTNSYFCIFREGSRNNRIEMGTFNCSSNPGVTASINGSKNPVNVNNLSGSVNQYYLDINTNTWNKLGTYTRITDNSTEMLYYNVALTNNTSLSDGTQVDNYDVLLTTERPAS